MGTVLKLIFLFSFLIVVFAKKPHLKVDSDDDDTFMNLLHDEEIQTNNERYARHIKPVTADPLERLKSELRYEYFNSNYNKNNPLRKFIRKINSNLERKKRAKLVGDNKKKNMGNIKKNKGKKKVIKKIVMKKKVKKPQQQKQNYRNSKISR